MMVSQMLNIYHFRNNDLKLLEKLKSQVAESIYFLKESKENTKKITAYIKGDQLPDDVRALLDDINDTISEYFITFAMDIARNIQKTIVKYLSLYPDAQSKILINHYKDMGFNLLNKEWLFIKID